MLKQLLNGSIPLPQLPARGARPNGTQSAQTLEPAPALIESPLAETVKPTAKQRAAAYAKANGLDGLAFTALTLLTMHAESGELADLQQAQESLDMLATLENA